MYTGVAIHSRSGRSGAEGSAPDLTVATSAACLDRVVVRPGVALAPPPDGQGWQSGGRLA